MCIQCGRRNDAAVGVRDVVHHPHRGDMRQRQHLLERVHLDTGDLADHRGREVLIRQQRLGEVLKPHQHPTQREDLSGDRHDLHALGQQRRHCVKRLDIDSRGRLPRKQVEAATILDEWRVLRIPAPLVADVDTFLLQRGAQHLRDRRVERYLAGLHHAHDERNVVVTSTAPEGCLRGYIVRGHLPSHESALDRELDQHFDQRHPVRLLVAHRLAQAFEIRGDGDGLTHADSSAAATIACRLRVGVVNGTAHSGGRMLTPPRSGLLRGLTHLVARDGQQHRRAVHVPHCPRP